MSFWPYTALEKSKIYQWFRAVVLLVFAPGTGVWMLSSGECKRSLDYVGVAAVLAIGLICWGALIAGLVRRLRTGKWTPE